MIRRCLANLSPEHAEIIDLVYYQEKSIKEIVEILDIPENTVKTRMFYARKRLAALVAAAGHFSTLTLRYRRYKISLAAKSRRNRPRLGCPHRRTT